jgi:hypothetical protein
MLRSGSVASRLAALAAGTSLGPPLGNTAGLARHKETRERVAHNARPKFTIGDPVLGAIPADPEANPVWEL